MIDLPSQAMQNVATHSAWAPIELFAAGILSSIGPCMAPRMIAVSAIIVQAKRRNAAASAGAFAAGLVFAYASFGAAAAVLARAVQSSTALYAALAVALGAGGILTLCQASHRCERRSEVRTKNLAAIFLLGSSFALVVSPCCTPVVLGILAYGSTYSHPWTVCLLLAAFAAGHTLVLFSAGLGGRALANLIRAHALQEAATLVSGTLMLALAGYYVVLA